MSLKYVKSKQGRDQLSYKGYLYTKERVFGNKTVWKCAIYHRDRCPGRAHTCDNRVIKYLPHHHPPSKTAGEDKIMECHAKATTSSSPQLTRKVVPSNSDGLLEAVPTKKLCIQNVKQTFQRLKARLNATRQGTCDSQTPSATVTKPIPEESSSLSLMLPDLHGSSERVTGGSSMDIPRFCEKPQTSHSTLLQASQEAGRQRFRSGTVPPGSNPQEILSWISEAARQWLCPLEHNKDQIVDTVILEQFLAVLPVDMQAWVRAREPSSSTEAVQLAEIYLGDQELARAGQELGKDLVTFEDIAVHFSEEEWALLDQGEKTLYWNVMHQNYDNVAWLSGTESKREEDPWQQTSEPVVELLKKSNKEDSWGSEEDLIRGNHLERKPKSSAGEEDDIPFISNLKEITRDAERGLETRCAYCGKRDVSSEEDAKYAVLSEEIQETSEKKISQNPEENLIKEDEKGIERQQSNNPRIEEKLILFRNNSMDHQDSGLGWETPCMGINSGNQEESLILPHDQSIYIGDDFECVALTGGLLLISEEEISQSPEVDSQPEPMHVYSLTELNKAYSQESVNGTVDITSKKNILEREQICSPRKEGEGKPTTPGNGLLEQTKALLLLHAQPSLESQPTCPNLEEYSKHNSSQKGSPGEDLSEGSSHKRQLIQSIASTQQPHCSDSGANSDCVSVLKKHRFDKNGKPCSGNNIPVKSVLGTQRRLYLGRKPQKRQKLKNWWGFRKRGCRFPELQMGQRAPWKRSPVHVNAQPHEMLQMTTDTNRTTSDDGASSSDSREAKCWQKASSLSLLDKMVAEPVTTQLMAVLEQVAADTAEIKSTVSRLHPTVIGIQNALGNLCGTTNDAEHRISDLEFTSRNTKAQLVQHCNDIKAIEAKLVGKAVQTNVIAGLWPSLGLKRKMSP
ncbi:zinc finger protein 483-like isoform X2 [Eublepharis macularius]|uniref:Zinc finger protein 483-like isoform X2 n=1 Tax=Eublepharis macularius TaxID=481883 RepID=A0AA97KWL8_EUBMA|nr:zinc finger protein 483-like isoform X2 [Eublepharis macularius]